MSYRNIGMMLAVFAAVTTSPALATDCSQQAHLARPIPLGVSGGNINDFNKKQTACFGGTLGALIQNKRGTQFILSNNHVLAEENKARHGDPIVQPGLIDTDPGCAKMPSDAVAMLTRAVPLKFGGAANLVDAAIAEVNSGDVSDSILNVGTIASTTVQPKIGMAVEKMGRTTCFTVGTIKAIGVNVNVQYTHGVAAFNNQVRIHGDNGAFSDRGDSGALIVTQENCPRAVALLFAGTNNNVSTFANPIRAVLKQLAGAPGGLSMVGGCTPAARAETAPPEQTAGELGLAEEAVASATAIRDRHKHALMKIPGAVGTGIGVGDTPGQPVIEVYVKRVTPAAQAAAPADVEGVPVRLIETGGIIAY